MTRTFGGLTRRGKYGKEVNREWGLVNGKTIFVIRYSILDIRYSILENRGSGIVNGKWHTDDTDPSADWRGGEKEDMGKDGEWGNS
jgi:hypothetical protein